MKRLRAADLPLIVLAALTLAALDSCRFHTETPHCVSGDLTSLATLFHPGSNSSGAPEWLKNARSCTVGDYQILTPLNPESANLMILKKGLPVFSADPTATVVYDGASWRSTMFWAHDANDRERNYVSYRFFSTAVGGFVEATDQGPNGTIIRRTTEVPGQPIKNEFRVGDRWLQLVKQNGAYGTILDGRFMPISEARRKLGDAKPVSTP